MPLKLSKNLLCQIPNIFQICSDNYQNITMVFQFHLRFSNFFRVYPWFSCFLLFSIFLLFSPLLFPNFPFVQSGFMKSISSVHLHLCLCWYYAGSQICASKEQYLFILIVAAKQTIVAAKQTAFAAKHCFYSCNQLKLWWTFGNTDHFLNISTILSLKALHTFWNGS